MARLYQAGDAYTKSFTISNSTGAAANADSLPTGSILRNGAADGAVTVTITNPATGQYKAAATIPGGYAVDDVVELLIAATVGGVATKSVVDTVRLVAFDPSNAASLALTDLAGNLAANAAIQADTDNLQTRIPAALVGGRMDSSIGALAAAGVTAVADAVWNAVATAYNVALSMGNKLNGAASAGDPWSTAVPGAYGAGTAGNMLGAINSAVDTEVAAVLAAVDTEVAAIKAKTDNLPASPAAVGSAMLLTLAQAIPNGQVAGTVGDALVGAEAQGLGKWTLSPDGLTLTIYRHDGVTVARVFTIDSATVPTSRV